MNRQFRVATRRALSGAVTGLVVIGLVISGAPLSVRATIRTGVVQLAASVADASLLPATERVSVSSTGTQGTAWSTARRHSISADGRYVVFESTSLFVPGPAGQIYVRDRQLGTTTVVSVSNAGVVGNAFSTVASISSDGRYVAFLSEATNLVAGDTNGAMDAFVRDLASGVTTMVSSPGNAETTDVIISGNGQFTLFASNATNLTNEARGGLFIHNLTSGSTTWLLEDEIGLSDVSADGTYVTYSKIGPPFCCHQVYLRTVGGAETLISSVGGLPANGDSMDPTVASDGTVAFDSAATDLPGGPGLYIATQGALSRIDLGGGAVISADGRFVIYNRDGPHHVYIFDRTIGQAELLTVDVNGNPAGDPANGDATSVGGMSANGRWVSFGSNISNLIAADTNNVADAFVRDRGAPPDAGTAASYAFGSNYPFAGADEPVQIATGNYTTAATDLALPGRLLGFSFIRTYNSADQSIGSLGPGWTHSYNWRVTDAGTTVVLRRGDGRQDVFTKNQDGTYADPQNVFDTLTKNGDNTYTVTLTNQVVYEFSTTGALVRIHEPAGNQIQLAYTGANLTGVTDTVGRLITLSYDGSNRLITLQDSIARKVTYAYDSDGRLATVTDKIGNATGQNPALHKWQYGYDPASRHLVTITDPDGRIRLTNTYDSQGRIATQKDAINPATTFTYSSGQTVVTDSRGHASTFTFDARMRLLTQTDVVGTNTYVLAYTYDSAGNVASVADRNNQTTDYTYDVHGNVLMKTDPQVDQQTPRYVTQFVYDSKNNLTQVTDPRTFVTTNAYDATTNVLLSVTAQIDATTNAVTKYEYADAANKGMPTRSIAPRGNINGTPDYAYATNLTYDTQGNVITRIDPDGAKTTFAYDAVGRQTSRVDPDGYAAGASTVDHTWITTYDENDQVKTEADPLAGVIAHGYDGAGNQTTLTDRDGNSTTYTYDNNARLATVAQKPNPVGNPSLVYTTQVTRDANGNATHVTQANGVVTDYSYDELDRTVSSSTHPDGSTTLTTAFALDGDGNMLTKTTPAPELQVTTNTYDALSRLTSTAATGLITITYQYDGSANRIQMIDGTGTTTYEFDGLGRMTQAAQPNGTLTYTYDRDGNRTVLTYPAGADTVTYTFTPGGRLDHLTDASARTSTYTYTASGLVKTLLLPDNLLTTYSYDRGQRLTLVLNAVGTTTRTRHAYTLDAEGNRTALDEYVEGITTVPSTTWAASVKANSDTGTTVQDHPAIALGVDGAHYLIWDDARDGNANIYFSRRDPVTGTWSTPNTKVNNDTGTRVQVNPAIALDGANNAYAVWEDSRDGANNKIDTNIYSSKRTSTTGVWSANVRVNDDATGNPVQRNPRIAGTTAGLDTAVWVDLRASQNNIYSAQLTTAGGTAWGPNKKVTDNTAAVKDFPDVAVGTDGTAYAVWQDSRNGNADIYFSKLTPGANAWTTNQKVSDDPGSTAQTNARVGVDATGTVTVIWLDARTSPAKIRMSRLVAGSATWSASSIVTDASARPLSTALSVRADGKAFVAFHDNRAASTDVYGTEYDPWLNIWTTSTLVSDDAGSTAQQSPSVAYGPGEIAAAWRDDRAGNADIRARRAALAGTDHFGYSYDGLERLTGGTTTNPESFVLDAGSNIASRTGPTATYAYDTSNRVTGDGTQSFTWSPSDRLTNRGPDTFGYDPVARMTSSTVAATGRSYAYNGDGMLQSRTQGTTTSFLWDPGAMPSPLLEQGSDRVIYGLGPLYVVKGDGTTVSFGRDGGKSVRAELNGSGTVTASFRYRAYGAIAQSSGANAPSYLGYAGQLQDPSGLLYMRARWYDPSVGRFTTRDSGEPVLPAPATLNSYGYGWASPLSRSDPTGARAQSTDDSGCVTHECEVTVAPDRRIVLPLVLASLRWSDLQGATSSEISAIVKGAVDSEMQDMIAANEANGWTWDTLRSGAINFFDPKTNGGDRILFEIANPRHPLGTYLRISVSSAQTDVPGMRPVQEFRTYREWKFWPGIGGGGGGRALDE